GDVTLAPAGRYTEDLPSFPVAPNGSLPVARRAPPLSVQPDRLPSKSPPGTSLYWFESLNCANGCASVALSHASVLISAALAEATGTRASASAPSKPTGSNRRGER